MTENITWTEKTVLVAQLRPYERNPRVISKEAYDRLKTAIQKMGFHQRILCQPDFSVIGGHQRIKALTELGVVEIPVLVPSRMLTREEFRQLLIQDNLPFGQHDFDILSTDFEMEELIDWGMPAQWFGEPKKDKKEKDADTSSQLEGMKFAVVVECRDEQHQMEMLEKFMAEGYNVKALMS